jgi:hypothetical protein
VTDSRADTRLMTYAELGEAIGRSEVAARAMAMRKRWKRVLGNDGRARVAVPIELVERLKAKAEARALAQPDTRADGQPDSSANASLDERPPCSCRHHISSLRVSDCRLCGCRSGIPCWHDLPFLPALECNNALALGTLQPL